jgi:hypothetical protein
MSPEILLLLIVFVMLPLIQQLLNALRQQPTPDQRTEQQTRGGPPEPRSGTGKPLGRDRAGPHVPRMPSHEPADAAPQGFTASLQAGTPPMPGPPVHPSARRRVTVGGLHSSPGLRRSIVLMTILGPCRAIDAYAWPDRTSHR